ncbi:hypothetical protein QQS21_006884 [Conoideocrella luteorostrata]|uniref:Calcineurin-like phosphoesterase domain-containing protein n=1 Tax=Conoideocrella luteorostrata TaxID=1105319 RepID=A0AAJ0FZW8_9HYPO|nr:hypothetical protein QQS21_006884 [Conoideocrella luteorostrata]
MVTKRTEKKTVYPIQTFITDLSFSLGIHQFSQQPAPPGSIPARRLIIVGDVHGTRRTLEALLSKVEFDKAEGDELIFVGDLVNKGPDSPGVIDLAVELGARGVRGNHDDAVLQAAAAAAAAASALKGDQSEERKGSSVEVVDDDGDDDVRKEKEKMRKSRSDATAGMLSTRQIEYLASLPLIIRIELTGPTGSSAGPPAGDEDTRTLVVVHAGLVPRTALEEQSPHAVMHMRSLARPDTDADGLMLVPLEEAGEEGWIAEWDRWQEERGGGAEKTMVVFGHDAKRRLQRGRWAVGLDTGCVYGGQLSAWVVGEGGSAGGGRGRLVQVDCVGGDEKKDV